MSLKLLEKRRKAYVDIKILKFTQTKLKSKVDCGKVCGQTNDSLQQYNRYVDDYFLCFSNLSLNTEKTFYYLLLAPHTGVCLSKTNNSSNNYKQE